MFDPTAGPIGGASPEASPINPNNLTASGQEAATKLVDPNGKTWDVPASMMNEALDKGFRPEYEKEIKLRDFAQGYNNPGGSAFVGAASFANQAAFGLPELIIEKTDFLSETGKDRFHALNEQHDAAHTVGGIGGFVANLFVGGPLFKGAAKLGTAAEGLILGGEASTSTARAILAASAKTATESAVITLPHSLTEAALGDPQDSAESMLMAVGIGAVLGGAGKGIGSAAKGIGKATVGVLGTKPVQTQAENMALRAIGAQKVQLKKLGAESKSELGQWVLNNVFDEGGLTLDQAASKIESINSSAGADIGKTLRVLDERIATNPELAGEGFNNSNVLFKIDDLIAKFDEPHLQAEARALRKVQATIEKRGGGNISFEKAQELKRMAQGLGKYEVTATGSMNDARKQVAGIISEELEDSASRVAEKTGEKELYDNYLRAKTDYRWSSEAEKMVANKISGDGNRLLGLTDNIIGGTLGGGAMTGVLSGHLGFLGLPMLGVIGKKIAESTKFQSMAAANLNKWSILFSAEANNYAASRIAKIPTILSKVSDGFSKVPAGGMASSAMAQLLGKEGNDKSKQEQFSLLSTKLAAVNSGDMAVDSHADLSSPVASGGAPELANAYQQKNMQALAWLHSQMPKPPPPKPFQASSWKPKDNDLITFEQKAEILLNPFAALNHLERGTLTKSHVDALRSVYPRIYGILVNQIKTAGSHENAKPLGYGARLKLSLLTGEDFDDSVKGENIVAYQANFTAPDETGGKKSNVKGMPSMQTETGRVSAGQPR